MKKIALLFSVAILATSCQAQQEKTHTDTPEDTFKKTFPKGNWTVNKETDERGNIIRYDSIYSWSSSSSGLSDHQQIHPDSIFKAMREQMRASFGMLGEDPFTAPFLQNDSPLSSFMADPLLEDFFKDVPSGFPDMEAIRERMRSLQDQFMRREESPWIPAVPEKEPKDKKSSLTGKSI